MIREVFLQRKVAQEAMIAVEASSDAEAEQLALQRANDDLVAWTVADQDVSAEVLPCRR